MPTYEYLCRTCSHRFETWQKMTDEPLTVCPECGNKIRRILFPAGVVFKGQGFYKTDHANGSSLPPGEIKAGENGKSESKSGEQKSGESKPAETGTATSTPAAKSESASTASSS